MHVYKIQTPIGSSVAGPEYVPTELVKAALAPIALVGESHQYPPVNWASILSPLMRLNFGKIVSYGVSCTCHKTTLPTQLAQNLMPTSGLGNYWRDWSVYYAFKTSFLRFASIYFNHCVDVVCFNSRKGQRRSELRSLDQYWKFSKTLVKLHWIFHLNCLQYEEPIMKLN